MDTLRGNFDTGDGAGNASDWDGEEDDVARDLPPPEIGQDERRMQVRAYNHWAGMLGEHTFPSIEDLDPRDQPDFGQNSVLLDFSTGIEDPVVQFLGDKLAEECGTDGEAIDRLSDVPPRSLLSRITDHYMQILANEAPIGFEAEFVNQRGSQILYRGILLPYSSDDETIDFIYGVINWKEMADAATADALLLEIDQALEGENLDEEIEEDEPHKHPVAPVTDWADSPINDGESVAASNNELGDSSDSADLSLPDFDQYNLDDLTEEEEEKEEAEGAKDYGFASLSEYIETPTKKTLDLESLDFEPSDYEVDYGDTPADEGEVSQDEMAEEELPEAELSYHDDATISALDDEDSLEALPALGAELADDANLFDCLASARQLAESARASEDRTRHALYSAVSRAYDFALAANDAPDEYARLLDDSGLEVQDRAPMTPVVKLVFGVEYDKTRLTEYAAVLSHAQRLDIERGSLAEFLSEAEGGLKGVVKAERRLRREEAGKSVESADAVRKALAKKLRELEAMTLDALANDGPEFGLVMIRRGENGDVELLGEIESDVPTIERAAKMLFG
ncbi:MAG: hypothetical protein ABJP70_03550 [Erythrobacter sp.]